MLEIDGNDVYVLEGSYWNGKLELRIDEYKFRDLK
jgi:hypothetical protein